MESRFFMSYKYTMLLLRTIFIVSIVWLSFFGPYKAFLNSNPIQDKNFIDVLSDAKKLGYAESNPSADLNGDDVSAKLKILSSLCFNSFLNC